MKEDSKFFLRFVSFYCVCARFVSICAAFFRAVRRQTLVRAAARRTARRFCRSGLLAQQGRAAGRQVSRAAEWLSRPSQRFGIDRNLAARLFLITFVESLLYIGAQTP